MINRNIFQYSNKVIYPSNWRRILLPKKLSGPKAKLRQNEIKNYTV